MGCSPWDCKEWYMTEQLSMHTYIFGTLASKVLSCHTNPPSDLWVLLDRFDAHVTLRSRVV